MSKVIFKVLRKEGWELNSNDEVVNDIITALDKNGGHCPTKVIDRQGHDFCPCHDYIANNVCHCGLYLKQPKINVE